MGGGAACLQLSPPRSWFWWTLSQGANAGHLYFPAQSYELLGGFLTARLSPGSFPFQSCLVSGALNSAPGAQQGELHASSTERSHQDFTAKHSPYHPATPRRGRHSQAPQQAAASSGVPALEHDPRPGVCCNLPRTLPERKSSTVQHLL